MAPAASAPVASRSTLAGFGDIFDQAATTSAASKRDIFDEVSDLGFKDEVALKSAGKADISDLGFEDEKPAPVAPVDKAPAAPAGSGGWLPGAPAAPTVPIYSADGLSMSGNNPLTLKVGSANSRLNTNPQMKAAAQASRDSGSTGEVPGGMGVGEQAAGVVKDIGGGTRDIYQGAKADFKASGGNPLANGGKSSSPDALKLQRGGAARLISGAGTAALALSAPELLEIGSAAVAGDKAAQIGLAKVVAGAAAGTGASAAGGAVADKLNTTPETKALVQASMFFFPTVAGALLGTAGFKAGAGVDAEGNLGAGVRSPGGGARAGVRVTPEAYEGGVQLGGTKVNVRIPRAPSATEVIGQQVLDANVETMKQSAQADAAAALIVKGATPQEAVAAQQPKAPDHTPDEMRNGVLSPQMVDSAAQIIKASPAEEQPNLMMQAAGALSGWIQKVKQFIGPDGKLALADTPQAADKLAQKILNDEVDRHDAVAADAAKQQQEATEAAQAPATPSAGEGKGKSKLQQVAADRQYARAKTMIEASDSPEAAVAAMGRAQIPPEQAQQFIARHQQEQVAATTPTVGSAAEPVVEESRKTIDAQMDALKAGTIKVVMLPVGSRYRPALPPGMKVIDVGGDAPGAGKYIFDPTRVSPKTIREAAESGVHGDLMGHVATKEEVAAAPQTVAVVAHKPDGTEIQTSEVPAEPAKVQAQVASMAERHPAAQVSIKPIDDVIGDRLAAQQEESAGDIFDQVAPDVSDLGFEDEPIEPAEQIAAPSKDEKLEAEDPEKGTGVEHSASANPEKDDSPHEEMAKRFENRFDDERYGMAIRRGSPGELQAEDGGHVPTYQELKSGYAARIRKGIEPEDLGTVLDFARSIAHNKGEGREHNEAVALKAAEPEHKYSFGSTQSDLPKGSDASKAIDVIRGKIDKADLAGDGIDIDENHVTVRYGIQGGNVEGIRAYLKKQAPFEAHLGATATFPPSKNSDGASVIQAPVESPHLHRMNEEIAKHGDFKESDFPDYKPHVTVAYVKPDAAKKYVGLDDAKGKTFRVDSVSISDRDGGKEVIKLEGKAEVAPATPAAPTAVGDRVKFRSLSGSELTGTAKHVGKAVTRILGDDHKRYDVPSKNVLGAVGVESAEKSSLAPAVEENPSKTEGDGAVVKGLIHGSKTSIITPTRDLPAKYRLMEAADLIPSHNATSFAKNAAYPEGVQERAYDISKEGQARIIKQAQNYDPRYTVNDNPDATNGPPIVTPSGIVLGGNSRAMSTQRMYRSGGLVYRKTLTDKAAQFGLKATDVRAMKHPVLVREVAEPSGKDEMRRLATELNKVPTAAMSGSEKAVSAGKNIKPDTLQKVADMLNDGTTTLRKLMSNPKDAKAIVAMLEADGAITERERPGIVDTATGGLNDAGKDFVENALLGSVVDDPRVMDSTPKAILNKIEGSLGSISTFAGREDEWNLIPAVRAALVEHGEMARAGNTLDDHLGQTTMFGPGRNPMVDAIMRTLDGPAKSVRKAFREYAQGAQADVPGQSLLLGQAPQPSDEFNHAFDMDLAPDEFRRALVQAAEREVENEQSPGRLSGKVAPGDEGLSRVDAGGEGREGKGGAGSRDLGRASDGKVEQPVLHAQSEQRILDSPGFYVEPAVGNDAPIVRLDQQTSNFLNSLSKGPGNPDGFLPESTNAVSLWKSHVDYLLAQLKANKTERATELANAIRLARASHGGVILVKHGADAVKAEEQFHSFQIGHAEALPAIASELGNTPPLKLARTFMARNFGYRNDPFLAVLEASAKIANDDWLSTGLSKADGLQVLNHFFRALVSETSSDVLNSVPTMGKEARSIIDSLKGESHATGKSTVATGDKRHDGEAESSGLERDRRRLPGGRSVSGEGAEAHASAIGSPGSRQVSSGERVTETAAFKNWFGDSKVLDEDGQPLVVYHGTPADFESFSARKLGGRTGDDSALAGFFFTVDPDVTAQFHGESFDPSDYTFKPDEGARIIPAYLSIRNPRRVSAREFMDRTEDFSALATQAKDDGFDGIHVKGDEEFANSITVAESGADTWIAFRPTQIKSAIGNDGKFNPRRSSILHARSGKPEEVVESEYLKSAGFAKRALKALAEIKPVEDAVAFIGDEADRVKVSRDLHNRLYDLASQDNAAVLRAVQMLKALPGSAKDQEAIYHHLEDPKANTLTETQQDILDNHLTPLVYQAEHDFQVITEGGVPIDNYVHRQVRERGGAIDRLLERVKDGRPSGGGVGGGRLTNTAPAAKHRTMMAIERVANGLHGKAGERQVVSIKGGRVVALKKGAEPKDMGPLRKGLTNVGEEIDERMAPFVKRVTELRDEIAGAAEADRQEQLADVQTRIAELRKEKETLDAVKVRVGTTPRDYESLFDKGGKAIYSTQATFSQRAENTRKLEPLLKKEEALKTGKHSMMAKNLTKLANRRKSLVEAEADRDYFLNSIPPERFAEQAWRDRNGEPHKITQATTKEIEANTEVRYYHNAAASVTVNYLAMDKARRAYEFLENFKKSPEFAAGSHSLSTPGVIPKGWRATQLPQFRGYFFEPHIAEVLDTYAKAAVHDPDVLEKVGNFLRNSIFFNPLLHVPNLVNHWVVEKGVTSLVNPTAYPRATRAGIRAINAVIHQNADFLAALDHGAPLQSQQFETKQFADLFFQKMQDELGDPENSKTVELAKALGMAPVRLVQAIYKFSGKVTWYTNDIAFMQSTYEKMQKGMSLKDALTETGKHIPDYRRMTRIFDSAKLGSLMSNPVITMFGAYHYGALKSYGQMAKSLTGFNWEDAGTKNEKGEPTNSAGRTEAEEKLHGLDTLAMVALVTFIIYPLLDKLWKDFTGNDKAQMRRAGASTFVYNLAMLAKGEKTPTEVAESIATPAVPLKAGVEMAFNRDIRTGQRIYDPHAPGKVMSEQIGRRLLASVAPVEQGLQVAEGKLDVKKLMYSMVGVSFPLHGAEKLASMINAERMAALPPQDEASVIHSVKRSRALHDAWSGDRRALDALLDSDDYTRKEKLAVRKASLLPPIVYETRAMAYPDFVRVYNAATDEQKQQLRIPMARKLAALRKAGKLASPDDE